MKTLIVGGTSALGRALAPVLAGSGDVLTAGRQHCDIAMDLTEPDDRIVLPPDLDAVVHTAAHFGGRTAADYVAAEDVNCMGTLKVCVAAARASARHLVLISSQSASLTAGSEYFGIYALSKRHAEEVARLFCLENGLPLTILRPTQIYGNGDSFRPHQPFLHTMIDKARAGEDIAIFGSHDPRRNYIHVDDLTAVIGRVIRDRVEGTFSCAYQTDMTYSQIAVAAYQAFNTQGRVRFLADKPDIPDNVFESDNTLYERLDWSPRLNMLEGLRAIARDLR